MLPLAFALVVLSLSTRTLAHPPILRLEELIDGLSDTCACDPSCTTIVETECTDIQCACNLQLQAQQCVISCERTSEAVGLFNAYLDSCVKESLAIPTATLPVVGITSPAVANAQTQVQTSAQGSPASAGSGMGYDNAGASAQPVAGTAANWLQVDSINAGAGQTAGHASGEASATGISLTHYNTPGVAAAAVTGGPVTSTNTSTSTSKTAALDATESYFTQAVSEDCQTPCQCWKDAADVSPFTSSTECNHKCLIAPDCADGSHRHAQTIFACAHLMPSNSLGNATNA